MNKMEVLEISSYRLDIHNSMDESFKQNGNKTKIYAQNHEETTQNYQTHIEERGFEKLNYHSAYWGVGSDSSIWRASVNGL